MATGRTVILLVDDEQDIRTVARLTLQQLGGFEVLEAASGAEAIDIASRAKLDAVILDVMMPGMDGPQVLQTLRGNPATAALPIIFLTAKAMPGELDRLRALGPQAILTKPFDPAALSAQVRDALSRVTSARDAGTGSAPGAGGASRDGTVAIDVEALGKLRGLTGESGAELAVELIELFADNTGAVVPRLRELARGQPPGGREAERLAHSLKSSAATLGATEIAALASQIESLAAAGSGPDIAALVDRIDERLAPTLDRLRAEQARITGAA